MTSRVEQELVLFMDSSTGEIVIEGISCDWEQTVAKADNMREFRTGLVYEPCVAARIKSALNKRGVKVNGVPGKCLNISKDWLIQILAILYYGLQDQNKSDCLAYLKNAANNNSVWKQNPGLELQKLKELEYLNKTEQFNLAKRVKTASGRQYQAAIRIRTLIVDNDLISGKIMFCHLSPMGKCDIVNNGSDAIKAFIEAIDKGESYDLVTLDIMLPKFHGHEVLKRIRSIEEERGVASAKIIMTTALNNAKLIMSAFKEQCDAYLIKPIRKKILMKRLGELNLV